MFLYKVCNWSSSVNIPDDDLWDEWFFTLYKHNFIIWHYVHEYWSDIQCRLEQVRHLVITAPIAWIRRIRVRIHYYKQYYVNLSKFNITSWTSGRSLTLTLPILTHQSSIIILTLSSFWHSWLHHPLFIIRLHFQTILSLLLFLCWLHILLRLVIMMMDLQIL
jgi:hypothetical protein